MKRRISITQFQPTILFYGRGSASLPERVIRFRSIYQPAKSVACNCADCQEQRRYCKREMAKPQKVVIQ